MTDKDVKNKDTNTPEEPENNQDLENKLTEMENNWKRALADYQNLQKRAAEEKISFAQFANSKLTGGH